MDIFEAIDIFHKQAQQTSPADRRAKAENAIFSAIGIRGASGRDNFDVLQKYVQAWFSDQFNDPGTPRKGKWGLLLKASPRNIQLVGTINGREGTRSRKHFGALGDKATVVVTKEGLNFEPFNLWLSEEQNYG